MVLLVRSLGKWATLNVTPWVNAYCLYASYPNWESLSDINIVHTHNTCTNTYANYAYLFTPEMAPYDTVMKYLLWYHTFEMPPCGTLLMRWSMWYHTCEMPFCGTLLIRWPLWYSSYEPSPLVTYLWGALLWYSTYEIPPSPLVTYLWGDPLWYPTYEIPPPQVFGDLLMRCPLGVP